ncbi:MAG TPA: site-2 protease family protein [Nitrososphaerales archaeon]|nr:site-2 protease family protein [Nitrososphaerales archaeon]
MPDSSEGGPPDVAPSPSPQSPKDTANVPPPAPFPLGRPEYTDSQQEQLAKIIALVRLKFSVGQEYLREGAALEFYLYEIQKDTKSNFASLVSELGPIGYTAVLRRTEHGMLLTVLRKQPYPKQKFKIPLILLAATIITVLADGIIRATTYSDPVTHSVGLAQGVIIGLIYTAALMGILGVHELGHKIAAWHHKMSSSWPYFIPGIPGIWPTMGAVIRAPEPPLNRDSLFDLGLSGPIAGLVVTLIVSIIAVESAKIVPLSALATSPQTTNPDYYTGLLISFFRPSSQASLIAGPTFTLLYLAYSIGFLVTFLNLFPAWQLDGGHITNSAVSPRVHQILTYASAIVMLFIQFYFMAILVLVLGSTTPSLRPLDDVSPLSAKRKVLFVLVWVLSAAIYLTVIYNNAFFGLQPIIR